MSRLVLRHYQADAFNRSIGLLSRGVRRILGVAPCGAGKTVWACRLIEYFVERGARVAFVANRDELISQPCAKLDWCGVPHGVIKAGHDPRDMSASAHVIGIQTFMARLLFMPDFYDVVIFDEAHMSIANSFFKFVRHCERRGGRVIVFGLTATPYRTDGRGLGELYDEIIEVATTSQLIDEGFLVPPRIFRADVDLSGIDIRRGDYDEEQLGRAMNKVRIVGHAVDEYRRLCLGRRCLSFAVNCAHGQTVCAAYNAAGITAEYLDGETPAGERKAILRRFHDGRTMVLVNVMVLTTGYDESRVEVVQALRPTKSRCIWRQAIGRGLRPANEEDAAIGFEKRECILLDHANWTKEHGYVTDPDIVTLAAGLSQERPKVIAKCGQCGAVLASRPNVCPACGAPMATAAEDTIGLGDASVRLEEDAPFFGGFKERRAAVTASPYTPGRPNQFRVARRSRGL